MWTASMGCDPGSICGPGTQSRPSPGTGTAGCLLHPLQRGRPSSGASSLSRRERTSRPGAWRAALRPPWDLGRDGASSRCRRVLRVIPGPGVEGMRTELPTGGGLVAVCHYLHKEGSQSGQGKPQSQASLGNSRQGAGAGGRRDPEASASHHR